MQTKPLHNHLASHQVNPLHHSCQTNPLHSLCCNHHLSPAASTYPWQAMNSTKKPDITIFCHQAKHKCIFKYLTVTRKKDEGLMKAGVYISYQSTPTCLFQLYMHVVSCDFDQELKECMDGVKCYATKKARQHGEENTSINNRDMPVPWGLYEQFNEWFNDDGSKEGILKRFFRW